MSDRNIKIIVFLVSLVACICLLIGGFFAPPTGIIDNSVLIASGILMVWPITWTLPEGISAINEWRIKLGNFEIHAKDND